jgi:hypothetical protein
MKQADLALRQCLTLSSELKSAKAKAMADAHRFTKPDLRFLADRPRPLAKL